MSLLFQTFRKAIPAGLVILLFTACQEPPTNNEPYPNTTLTLKALDVSSTEARLRISLTGVDSTASDTIPLILKRDGETVKSLDFVPFPRSGSGRADTTIMDAGLEPGRSYSYTAYRQSVYNTALIDSSAPVSLTTLDTTSHDFTWTIDTLGSYGSYLNDVAIIDENNIWAVGNIETDSGSYNAARWDGEQWEMIKITPAGSWPSYPHNAIFALDSNDIWSATSAAYHWNGSVWEVFGVQNSNWEFDGYVRAIWGSSPEDVYFVGDNGSIVHYDGSGFTHIPTGINIDLLDVAGNSQGTIIATGYNQWGNIGSVILQYSNSSVTLLYDMGDFYSSEYGVIYCTEFDGKQFLIGTTKGIVQYNPDSGESTLITNDEIQWGDNAYLAVNTIRAQAPNDVVMVENWGGVVYYNGNTWNDGTGLGDIVPGDGTFFARGMDYKHNIIVIGGESPVTGQAITIIGKSND